MGADVWLERCERPNCWMALSADQGSSSVRWHRRRWFSTLQRQVSMVGWPPTPPTAEMGTSMNKYLAASLDSASGACSSLIQE